GLLHLIRKTNPKNLNCLVFDKVQFEDSEIIIDDNSKCFGFCSHANLIDFTHLKKLIISNAKLCSNCIEILLNRTPLLKLLYLINCNLEEFDARKIFEKQSLE
ncbi:MAG: hypothetical protein MHPSP_002557, partial [Paramarteilia canceri]